MALHGCWNRSNNFCCTISPGGTARTSIRASTRAALACWWAMTSSAIPIIIDPALGFERRWVIYNGVAEASMTPPGWNGWLHHTVDVPPTEEDYKAHPWELQHIGNPTGTPGAIRPDGSTLRPGPRQPTGGDYEAWSPGP